MRVNFIEYMVVDGQPITVDVRHELTPHGVRCFRIGVNQEDNFNFLLCKDSDQAWQVISQTHHNFIIVKLFDNLTTAIDSRLAYEKSYLLLN